jgi:hypothetical protein
MKRKYNLSYLDIKIKQHKLEDIRITLSENLRFDTSDAFKNID